MISEHTEKGTNLMKSNTVNGCTRGTNLLSYCPGILTQTQTSQIKLTDDVSRFQPVAD